MLIFQEIVIMRSIPPVAVAEQNVFSSWTHRKYRHILKGAVKSFFIAHSITASSLEHAGSRVHADIQTVNRNKDIKYDPGCSHKI